MWQRKIKLLYALSVPLMTGLLAAHGHCQGVSKLSSDQVEKVHGRLFHKGPVGQIPEMLAKSTGDVHASCVIGIVQRVMVVPPPSPVEDLGRLAAESDLVVLGKTGTGVTHMTADKDFLYTDWNFTIEEVLKSNGTSPVYLGATILVTRSGGKLLINRRTVYANCADFLDFAAEQEYLLYLRFVPETGAYTGDGWGAFAVFPSTKRLDASRNSEWKIPDKETLLKTARDGVAISGRFLRSSGGTLVMNGRSIRAVEGAFLPFHQGGRYLLFLYYVPTTGAYRAVNDLAFELQPNVVQTPRPNHPFVNTKANEGPQAFISEVRDAITAARESAFTTGVYGHCGCASNQKNPMIRS